MGITTCVCLALVFNKNWFFPLWMVRFARSSMIAAIEFDQKSYSLAGSDYV